MFIFVSTVFKNNKNQILMLKRGSKSKHYPKYWQLPEGKIEKKEGPTEAMYRELKEELGYKPKNLELKYIIPSQIKKMLIRIQMIRIVFESNENINISLSSDHSEYRWFEPKKILDLPIVPGTKDVIEKYIK